MNRFRSGGLLLGFTLFLLPLHADRAVVPSPPVPAYIHEYDLPPDPALPIVEYRLPDTVSGPAAAVQSSAERVSAGTKPVPPAAAQVTPPASDRNAVSNAAPVPAVSGDGVEDHAPSTSAQPQSSPAGSAAAPAPEQSREPTDPGSLEPEIYARLGDLFTLVLDGGSWLFTDLYPQGDGIKYNGRSRDGSGIRFRFSANTAGKYILSFMQGSSQGGAGSIKRTVVEVLSDKEFMQRVAGADSSGPDSTDTAAAREDAAKESPGYASPQKALADGEYRAAYELLEAPATYGDLEANQRLALLYTAAILGQIDDSSVSDEIRALTGARQQSFLDRLTVLGGSLPEAERLRIYAAAARDFPSFSGIDTLVFDLGGLYQKPGSLRDIEQAIRYYTLIITDYPLSRHWEEARRQVNYLERHFLLVR